MPNESKTPLTSENIVNAIRDNVQTLAGELPVATKDNFPQIGRAFDEMATDLKNEFITTLINMIVKQHISNKMYNNPLGRFKRDKIPFGVGIEDIYTNPVVGREFSMDGNLLLKNSPPDSKAVFYTLNRESTYPVTIMTPKLNQAFKSARDFMQFYNSIVSALYSGDSIDEYELMKNNLSKVVDLGVLNVVDSDISSKAEITKLMKSVSNHSKQFTFASTNYAPYNLQHKTEIDSEELTAVKTWCEQKDQVLFLRADVQTEIDFELISSYFNVPAELLERITVIVDNFPSETKDIFCILADEASLNAHDNYFEMESQRISANASWQIFLHHFQTIYFRSFANAVAFGKDK